MWLKALHPVNQIISTEIKNNWNNWKIFKTVWANVKSDERPQKWKSFEHCSNDFLLHFILLTRCLCSCKATAFVPFQAIISKFKSWLIPESQLVTCKPLLAVVMLAAVADETAETEALWHIADVVI